MYIPLVERYVGEVLDDEQARDDVVQDVFMWLYSHEWSLILPRPGSLRRWLRSLSMKLALKDSEKRKNWQQTVDPIVLDELAEEYTPGIDEIDAEHRAWLVERAKSFIRKEFRPVGWEIFRRVYENHERVLDVARDLGVSRNVVHIYGCRMIARLKTVIRDFIDEF